MTILEEISLLVQYRMSELCALSDVFMRVTDTFYVCIIPGGLAFWCEQLR